MGWPTDTQIDQAAETLCRMAEIPGLDRGRAIFKHDLQRVEWYSPLWEISGFGDFPVDLEVHIPHGPSYDSRAELFGACKWNLDDALWAREYAVLRMLPTMFALAKEAKEGKRPKGGWSPDDFRRMAALLNEGEQEWRERIDAEWPPLQAVAGGEDR